MFKRILTLWVIAAAFLPIVPVYGAIASDTVCEERKRASMEQRLDDTAIEFIKSPTASWETREVTIDFVRLQFGQTRMKDVALTFGCKVVEEEISFPHYAGFGWVVAMPDDATFSLVDRSISDTTIRSYLDEERGKASNSVDALRMLVSGPFWRLGRHGEVPIGALVRDGKFEENYRDNFSARHVLCATEGGVELMDRKMFEAQKAKCSFAFQLGPALFERSTSGRAKLGIGSNSMNRSRRNILIKVDADGSVAGADGSLILLSTLFDIAVYDAMIASELLVRKLPNGGEIAWAVGLVDDESLSGPVLTMRGRVLELAEAGRPTGAIMQLIFDGDERSE